MFSSLKYLTLRIYCSYSHNVTKYCHKTFDVPEKSGWKDVPSSVFWKLLRMVLVPWPSVPDLDLLLVVRFCLSAVLFFQVGRTRTYTRLIYFLQVANFEMLGHMPLKSTGSYCIGLGLPKNFRFGSIFRCCCCCCRWCCFCCIW